MAARRRISLCAAVPYRTARTSGALSVHGKQYHTTEAHICYDSSPRKPRHDLRYPSASLNRDCLTGGEMRLTLSMPTCLQKTILSICNIGHSSEQMCWRPPKKCQPVNWLRGAF